MQTKTTPTASADAAPVEAAKPLRKSALVLKLLGRAKGATLAEIAEPTGWQPHSTRAFLSRLRTKGVTITRDQRKSGETAYRVVARAAVDAGIHAAASANANTTSSAAAEPAAQ